MFPNLFFQKSSVTWNLLLFRALFRLISSRMSFISESFVRLENATGTVISKQPDVEQKPDTKTIQASVPSSFELMEKPYSDGILQKRSEDSTKAGAGSDTKSTLKSATISHKAFSVQDKVRFLE